MAYLPLRYHPSHRAESVSSHLTGSCLPYACYNVAILQGLSAEQAVSFVEYTVVSDPSCAGFFKTSQLNLNRKLLCYDCWCNRPVVPLLLELSIVVYPLCCMHAVCGLGADRV